jgi:hypothetical protein
MVAICPTGRSLFFSKRKKLSAGNWRMDVVRRAARFRVDSHTSLVVNLDEALRPPLLRVMQNIGHWILSPLKKRETPLPDISSMLL